MEQKEKGFCSTDTRVCTGCIGDSALRRFVKEEFEKKPD
jgi:hypothetical protein